jgi:hypothetical protein
MNLLNRTGDDLALRPRRIRGQHRAQVVRLVRLAESIRHGSGWRWRGRTVRVTDSTVGMVDLFCYGGLVDLVRLLLARRAGSLQNIRMAIQ